jgi:hypothetical protein
MPFPRIMDSRTRTHPFGIEIHYGIQFRIQPFNLTYMSFGKFNNGNSACVKKLKLTHCRLKNEVACVFAHCFAATPDAGINSSAGVECIQ